MKEKLVKVLLFVICILGIGIVDRNVMAADHPSFETSLSAISKADIGAVSNQDAFWNTDTICINIADSERREFNRADIVIYKVSASGLLTCYKDFSGTCSARTWHCQKVTLPAGNYSILVQIEKRESGLSVWSSEYERKKITVYSPEEAAKTVKIKEKFSEYAKEGELTTYRVEVTGTNAENYKYEWYYPTDGQLKQIPGAGSASYTAAATDETSKHYYLCRVLIGSQAKWTSKMRTKLIREVRYDENIGEGVAFSQTKYDDLDLVLSQTIPTRTGYQFLGWSDKSNATTALYQPGDLYTTNSAVTLYAVWKPDEYIISYNLNGASGTIASQTKKQDETLCLSASIPTREGYDFLGWSESPTAVVAAYEAGESYTKNGDVTLYAVWKQKEYKITYDMNGGSGNISDQTKKHGEDISLSIVSPTKSRYVFEGWATNRYAEKAEYALGELYKKDEAITLYAVWSPEKYTVTYDPNGGMITISSSTKIYGEALKLTTLKPYREGYDFLGWSTSASAVNVEYNSGEIYWKEGDTTLYAVWKIKTYVISYDANGGIGGISSQTKVHGENIMLSSQQPTRTGYDFLGWSTNRNATVASFGSGGIYEGNGTQTLYAVWKLKTYRIEFYANGGEDAPGTKVKEYGQKLRWVGEMAYRDGYIFVGWATSPKSKVVAYLEDDVYEANESVALYAIWEKEKVVKSKPVFDVKKNIRKKYSAKKFKLPYTTDTNGRCSYRSSNEKVAKISSKGKVSIVGYGKVKITILTKSTKTYRSGKKTVNLTIIPNDVKGFKASSPQKGKLRCAWTQDKAVSGVEIRIGSQKTSEIKEFDMQGKTWVQFKGGTRGNICYASARNYVVVNGKRIYGNWTEQKSVKIK